MWGGGMWPEAEPMGGGGMWPEGEPTSGGMWPEAEPRDECGGCVATCMANFAEMGPEMEPHSHSSGPPECMRDCYFACTAHLADQSPPLDHATCGCGATETPLLPLSPLSPSLRSCTAQLLRATSPRAQRMA